MQGPSDSNQELPPFSRARQHMPQLREVLPHLVEADLNAVAESAHVAPAPLGLPVVYLGATGYRVWDDGSLRRALPKPNGRVARRARAKQRKAASR